MKSTDQSIIAESERLKKTADKVLDSSGLVKILSRFGQASFQGGYAANLLMSGDVDIYVVGKFSTKDKVLKIFHAIIKSTTFNSYCLADHKKFAHKRGIFPNAYYIGLKARVKGEKWKIDIWFLTPTELKKVERFDLDKHKITPQQKLTILKLKAWRNRHNPKISGYHIYKAVLEDNIKTIVQFKKSLVCENFKIFTR